MPRKKAVTKHKGVYEKYPGSGIWWVRWTDAEGKRRTESIGTHGDAVARYQTVMTEKRTGVLIPIKKARGLRFEAIAKAAIEDSKSHHRDHRNFKQRLESASSHFGRMVADHIKPNDIRDWLNDQAEDNEWEPATFNRYKAAISKAYKLALSNGDVHTNPARFVQQRKESHGRVRFLQDDEEDRLREAILNKRPHCIYQFDVALHTGMRKGNQFTVTWSQVDFKRSAIDLDTTKNGSAGTIHLNQTALESLKALKSEHEKRGLKFDTLFFDHRSQPIRDPREWFAEACSEAKVTGVTWHTLRHTFASRLVMAGVDLKTVQEAMLHKTIAMTARYAHLSPKHLKDAVSRLDGKKDGTEAQRIA